MTNICSMVDYGVVESTILENKILGWKIKFKNLLSKVESGVKR